jgi:molybdopterin-synthase adenylyltransferase
LLLYALFRDACCKQHTMTKRGLVKHIVSSAEPSTDADGQKYPAISLRALSLLAEEHQMAVKDAEIISLKNGVIPRRYLRNVGSIGVEGQIKLLQSSVAVVGAGGLGGTIIELLARQGTGNIVIIDNDRFTEQNLNRQLLSTEKNLGKYKAEAAASRVKQINSAVTLTVFLEKLNEENAKRLLQGVEVVADALDNLPSRFALETACRSLGIPLVHGTIAGFCGQLSTIFPDDAGFRSIYGSSDRPPDQGIEVQIGNPSATPAVVAAWQVQEIVKIITGAGKTLRNSLLVLDMMEGTAERINLSK